MVSVKEQQQALWERYLAVDRRSLANKETADPQAKAIEDALFSTYWKLVQWMARRFVGPDRGPKRKHTVTKFADAVSKAAETWVQAMRTWKPGAAKFTSFAQLCVRRQLWKLEQQLATHDLRSISIIADPLTRLAQLGPQLAIETMASDPDTSEADLRDLRKAFGLREPRPKRAGPKACASS